MQTIEPGKELDGAQRKSCATLCLLNDGSVWRIEEFIFQSFTQLTHEQYHDRSVETQAWLSPSAKSVWHFTSFSLFFFSFFIYVCCRNATLSHSGAKKNIHSMPGTHCLQNCLSLWGAGEPFFLAQVNFFFTQPRSFWSFDVTRNKENNNSGLIKEKVEYKRPSRFSLLLSCLKSVYR